MPQNPNAATHSALAAARTAADLFGGLLDTVLTILAGCLRLTWSILSVTSYLLYCFTIGFVIGYLLSR